MAAFGAKLQSAKAFQNARAEFRDMSIGELKEYEELFKKYDTDGSGALTLQELKYMMEKLGAPQTHLNLKKMIAEVDEDLDGEMSYREFLLIFRYAKTGKLAADGLKKIAGSVATVNVAQAGVGGAKSFFEQQASELTDSVGEKDAAYREQAKAKQASKAQSKQAFAAKAALFQ